jgi:hypothetical protein
MDPSENAVPVDIVYTVKREKTGSSITIFKKGRLYNSS